MNEKVKDSPKFIDLPKISEITRLGKSTILAWEAAGKFPTAIRLSKTRRVWLETDVCEWMQRRHQERGDRSNVVTHHA